MIYGDRLKIGQKKRYPSVRDVDGAEHIKMVRDIFSTISDSYDLLNHILSLGTDIMWRKAAVKRMRFQQTKRFIDIACGTADLSIMTASSQPQIKVVGVDFMEEMLLKAGRKIKEKGLSERILLVKADGLCLSFQNSSFDVAGIAFGIRNMPDREAALKEFARVLVPGGQLIVLEMSLSQNLFMKRFYYTYLNRILPKVATRFSKNPDAYLYLVDSIMNFPDPGQFCNMMEVAGFGQIGYKRLWPGITYLHWGFKGQGLH